MSKRILACRINPLWSFDAVITACAEPRDESTGTWITDEMKQAYLALFECGAAHSVEVWEGDELVGGLYGAALGNMFFGESMFSKKSNSSKLAFITLSEELNKRGFIGIDCQIMNSHLASLGAIDIPRVKFLSLLDDALEQPTIKGPWSELFVT